jgi:hypothetical protein
VTKFGQETLKVVYTADAPEFHATNDRQTHDEDLIWSLYHPMLALFLFTMPVTRPVPREPDYDDEYMAEMKGVFSEKDMWAVEFFRESEKLELEQNPTREATSFPVKLVGIDNMPLEGHPGLEFFKEQLGGREIVTVADIEAIAAKWKAR